MRSPNHEKIKGICKTSSWTEYLKAKLEFHLNEALGLKVVNRQVADEFQTAFHNHKSTCAEVKASEIEKSKLSTYQMIRNIELRIVAKLHFSESEAKSYLDTTLVQMRKLL